MAGVRRAVAATSIALSIAVTSAIAANPTPWRNDPGPMTAAAPAQAPATGLSARAQSVLDRARAVQQRLDELASAPGSAATPSPPPPAAPAPAPAPPVAVTTAPPVTSSASS